MIRQDDNVVGTLGLAAIQCERSNPGKNIMLALVADYQLRRL